MSAPGGEEAEKRSPGTPNGDVMTPSDEERERFEFLEMNFKYPLVKNWCICTSYVGRSASPVSQLVNQTATPVSQSVSQSVRQTEDIRHKTVI